MIYQRIDEEYEKKITIEGQLHKYEQHPDKSERSSTLWHAWRQNKGWLIRLLELTLGSSPAYSRHNASHADAVLHNIERILGEERIQGLSATDCFAILHTVYVHDIGMVILSDDRKKIVSSDEFVDMVDELANGADEDLKRAALQLKKQCYKKRPKVEIALESLEFHYEKQYLYAEKLDTYYAIILLISEYQRRIHGEKAASRVKEWITDADKLRSEFAMSGIPMRIFFRIADCASLHTDWEFQHILDLPIEENGYDNDMLHPRFVAVLLQLGDALDIDNDRFHPFAQAFLGKFPMHSQAHYDKHLAIRTLKITPEEILIEADCATREAMRLVRNACDTLEGLLQAASYHWANIAPKGLGGALPAFLPPRLLLMGKTIPLDLAMMRFQISQRKAFSLLQGENIYSGLFPFVRELLQNAIDSTKIQCYKDYTTSSKFRFKLDKDNIKAPSITDISNIINPIEYPIEVSIKCGKMKTDGKWETVELDAITEARSTDEEYGILFAIRDYGTGIDRETLRAISNVGTSYQRRKKMMREMPEWLRPTGEFGIGLQSVFLITDKFYCETYVRNGERYGIEFRTGANGERGLINVEPKDGKTDPMAFGTEFQIFISHKKKKVRNEFMEAWPGYDPFGKGYEKEEVKRNILTLTAQILLDLDRQLENLLFPVYVHVEFDMMDSYKTKLNSKLSKIVFDNSKNNEKYTEENLKSHVCWVYQYMQDEKREYIKTFQMANGICMVDLHQMELNLWLEDISVGARIGVNRIVENSLNHRRALCKLYYKGILAETQEIKNDSELLECIDIQGGEKGKSLLQLSRNGFTEEGEKYIHEIVVPKIFQALYEALKAIADQEMVIPCENNHKRVFEDAVEEILQKSIKNAIENVTKDITWRRQVMGISLFYHFYMMERKREVLAYTTQKVRAESECWEEALKKVQNVMDEKSTKMIGAGITDVISRIPVLELIIDPMQNTFRMGKKSDISMAEFFWQENKFAVVSKRRYPGDKWVNYLIKFEAVYNGNEYRKQNEYRDIIEAIEYRAEYGDELDKKREYIEKWSNLMLENVEGIMEKQPIQQSDFIQWLMKFVPVIGNFSDTNGNLRIHVLSGRALESVFYNANAKYMILKKIADRTQQTNARRFAGYVWAGYEALKVCEVQKDVCSIKEPYIYENKEMMLFPCLGDAVRRLINLVETEEKDIRINIGKEQKDLQGQQEKWLEIGNSLERCVRLQIEKCKEIDLKGFQEGLQKYCARLEKVMKEESFWDNLLYGYEIVLESVFSEILDFSGKLPNIFLSRGSFEECLQEIKLLPDDSLVKNIVNELLSEAQVFSETVLLEKLQKSIYELVLEKEEYFTSEFVKGEGEVEQEVYKVLGKLAVLCISWKLEWDKLQQTMINTKIEQIQRENWDNSLERQNMAKWIEEKSPLGIDKDIALECNDRLWQEINEIVRERCQKNASKENEYRFIKLLVDIEKKGGKK